MRRILSLFASGSSSATTAATPAAPRPATVESLEGRTLFAGAPPVVTSVYSDSRGEVILQMSERLRAETVNNQSVLVHSAGADGTVLTGDDVKLGARVTYHEARRQILVSIRDLVPNTTYRVKLDGKTILAFDGWRLDGEFNGPNVASGDGVRGGDYLFASVRDRTTRPTARFFTTYGQMDVRLFRDLAPGTVANFLHYANEGAWDGTVFHRSAFLGSPSNGIIQGGGFNVNDSNQLDDIHAHDPIDNEFGSPNVRGTIAMAKTSDPDSATNQWFFNVGNNRAILDDPANSGGFTVFGIVANAAGLGVVDQISAQPRVNLGSPFNEIPVRDLAQAQQSFNPSRDTIEVRRLAMINTVVGIG